MKNIHFDSYLGPRLPREVQLRRIRHVIDAELTASQRYAVVAYYFRGQTIPQIARDLGVNKSTVSRTLRRGEARLKRYLKY